MSRRKNETTNAYSSKVDPKQLKKDNRKEQYEKIKQATKKSTMHHQLMLLMDMTNKRKRFEKKENSALKEFGKILKLPDGVEKALGVEKMIGVSKKLKAWEEELIRNGEDINYEISQREIALRVVNELVAKREKNGFSWDSAKSWFQKQRGTSKNRRIQSWLEKQKLTDRQKNLVIHTINILEDVEYMTQNAARKISGNYKGKIYESAFSDSDDEELFVKLKF
tara:strand:- start:309 stop:977 length:669 start_codon:yes stop_codon:yes gene_type:complete